MLRSVEVRVELYMTKIKCTGVTVQAKAQAQVVCWSIQLLFLWAMVESLWLECQCKWKQSFLNNWSARARAAPPLRTISGAMARGFRIYDSASWSKAFSTTGLLELEQLVLPLRKCQVAIMIAIHSVRTAAEKSLYVEIEHLNSISLNLQQLSLERK